MGNRKPNLSNLLAFLPPQEQFSPDMLLMPQAQPQPVVQNPVSMVNEINRAQTRGVSNEKPQLNYTQQLDQAFFKQIQDREAQAQQAQAKMQELQSAPANAFQEADLSTLLAYGDQLAGTRLAQAYKPPTEAQERKAMLEKLRAEVTKSQQGIADDQLAYLKMKAQEEKDRMAEQRMMAKLGSGSKVSNDFEKAYARKLGTAFSEYTTTDRPMILANIDKVDEAIGLMESGKVRGQTTYTPDILLGLKSPATITARDNIRSAIQDTLRPTLGAQFTENEGKRIMALAYDENLSPEINKQRAAKLKNVLATKVQFQDDLLAYIRANGGSDAGFPYQNYGMAKVGGKSPVLPKQNLIMVQKGSEVVPVLPEDLQQALAEGYVEIE